MTVSATIGGYLLQVPLYLVWLGGIILALACWQRHPRASLLAALALLIFLVNSLVGTALGTWLPRLLAGQMPVRRIGFLLLLPQALRGLVDAGAFGLLLAATFLPRREAAGRGEEGRAHPG